MPHQTPQHLTEAQISNFMRYGYLRLESCFTPAQAAEWTSQVWTRLGFDPEDKSTWIRERTNMPEHRRIKVSDFAPKAWAAICELCGGEERVSPESNKWNDALIVNLGSEEFEGKVVDPKELPGWHVDGDFFVHFLDSPEQGLLVIPLFTDIRESAGGTVISPDGVGEIARYLRDHPEGVNPRMNPMGKPLMYDGLDFYSKMIQGCTEFHEMTGNVGDVILLHPFMLHSASRNSLRIPRIITNPAVSLNKPFNYNREDPSDYSIVEKKTLQELGVDRLESWKIQGSRDRIIPERIRIQAQMMEDEKRRLQTLKDSELLEKTQMTAVVIPYSDENLNL